MRGQYLSLQADRVKNLASVVLRMSRCFVSKPWSTLFWSSSGPAVVFLMVWHWSMCFACLDNLNCFEQCKGFSVAQQRGWHSHSRKLEKIMLHAVGCGMRGFESCWGCKVFQDKAEEHLWMERTTYKVDLSWTIFWETSLRLNIHWSLLGYYFWEETVGAVQNSAHSEDTEQKLPLFKFLYYSCLFRKVALHLGLQM